MGLIVQLSVDSIFGGDEAVTNQYGNTLHYPVVSFVPPPEPNERIAQLITSDNDGNSRIYAGLSTTRLDKTRQVFESLAQDGREFDFEIDPPKPGKKKGWIRNYPGKPGDAGWDFPEDVELIEGASQTAPSTPSTVSVPIPVLEKISAQLTEIRSLLAGEGEGHHQEEGAGEASPESSWGYVAEVGLAEEGVLYEVAKARMAAGNTTPPTKENVSGDEVDTAVEAILGAGK